MGVEVSKLCGGRAGVLKSEAGAESEKGDSAHLCHRPEVVGVIFSESDPVPKFLIGNFF